MKPMGSRLSVLILRSKPSPQRAKACVSKDGRVHGRRLRPSFETHRLRDALRMRPGEDADMIRISETLH